MPKVYCGFLLYISYEHCSWQSTVCSFNILLKDFWKARQNMTEFSEGHNIAIK
jgi:hypothetical protein